MGCGGSGYKPISPFDERRIAYGRAIPCDGCDECPCPDCGGDGLAHRSKLKNFGQPCSTCNGTGRA